jgi:hypothetical protein
MLDDVRELRHDRRVLRAELDAMVEQTRHPSLRLALVSRFPWTGRFVKTPGAT